MLITIGFSCKTNRKQSVPIANTPVIIAPEGYESMTVKDYHELDACGFLLMNDDSVFFEPTKMDPAYFQNNLKVFVKYQLSKNQMSICMRGQKIDLLDIKMQEK